jgi:hypothetical protein
LQYERFFAEILQYIRIEDIAMWKICRGIAIWKINRDIVNERTAKVLQNKRLA